MVATTTMGEVVVAVVMAVGVITLMDPRRSLMVIVIIAVGMGTRLGIALGHAAFAMTPPTMLPSVLGTPVHPLMRITIRRKPPLGTLGPT
jgi:hypothetical protein